MTTSTKTPAAALAPDLNLEAASLSTLDWWDEHAMLDDLDHKQVQADHDQILTIAYRLGITTVRELAARADDVIAHTSEVGSIARFAAPQDADRLHRARNAIAAILIATEVRHADQPRPYDLVASLPAIRPRPGGKRRPLCDDEIVLMRSGAVHWFSLGGRYRLVAIQYALVETGARPMESTEVTVLDFDRPQAPTTVALPGVNSVSVRRKVVLGEWAARLLHRALDRHLALNPGGVHLPLCYTGRSGAHSASASATNNLKRAMQRVGVGVERPFLEGTAVTRWRVKRELDTYGEVAALKMMGQFNPKNIAVERVYRFLDQGAPTVTITPLPREHRGFKGL